MKGQHEAILKHLEDNRTITNMEAFRLYGVTRLSAIIFNLRKLGYTIKTTREIGKTRYGTCNCYGIYTLISKEKKDGTDISD